ncbi:MULTISPECIES: hypothetical protein [Providencia]|uniref:hypothetical protein n=1 Tax=Providencia TaxID=586 RepID=UPI00044F35E6|nr:MULTISPECIES: hypothetical protein [Providencia]EUD01857.1 hypothetical protein HMPREF1565_2566 [Providencia alcalifaciens RIMD 1656011]MBG5927780.1 hypothetical protein [Providencia rettgeri]MBS0861578.1 hypothetical protein [Providencia rettgeri]MBS0872922.1 hypothetical protein [Providencia rettgeri]MBS0922634.1 hypothetical protein [Providencia rettgeri]
MNNVSLLEKISNFLLQTELVSVCDDFHKCQANYKIQSTNMNDNGASLFQSVTETCNNYNLNFDINFNFDGYDPILITNKTSLTTLHDNIYNIKNNFDFLDAEPSELDSTISIDITIYKDEAISRRNTTHIFDYESFFSNFNSGKELQFLFKLKDFNVNEKIQFILWNSETSFNTCSLYFTSAYNHINYSSENIDRQSLISKRNKSCHFTFDSELKFIPDDFKLLTNCPYESIKLLFDKLLITLSLVYLSDYSDLKLESNEVIFKLKGYRLINNTILINEITSESLHIIYDIYSWVYTDGNFIDKLGLARNIISLYTKENDITKLSDGVLKSIESGYDIYLKENVKQYIEIKNKISEFLISQSDKASDITKNMFSSLKSSFWSIITFFLSIFLIRILLSKSYSGAITLEVVVVTLFFVAFSFVYLYLSLKEVNEEKDRLLNRYDTIRDRYKDLLNEDDLKNIINTEELKSNDKDYIDGRKKTYTKTWITFNVLMIVIVLILFFYMNSNDILSDTVEKISKFYNITLFYFE